jgi:hypothetical protein
MDGNIIRKIFGCLAIVLCLFVQDSIAGNAYKCSDNTYSDKCINGELIKPLVLQGFSGYALSTNQRKYDKRDTRERHYVTNVNINQDPMIGIALESSFLLDLYRRADRFIDGDERNRVMNEAMQRINILQSRIDY